ncbi:MAG: hypothetical protein ACM3ST_09790 [Bdellovibrio bacteriovorus]
MGKPLRPQNATGGLFALAIPKVVSRLALHALAIHVGSALTTVALPVLTLSLEGPKAEPAVCLAAK